MLVKARSTLGLSVRAKTERISPSLLFTFAPSLLAQWPDVVTLQHLMTQGG
ncbi:MAG TPA: hypothetical protein VF982_10260 [Anaerolineales bacterium]